MACLEPIIRRFTVPAYNRAGTTVSSVGVSKGKDIVLQWQIGSPFVPASGPVKPKFKIWPGYWLLCESCELR